MIKIIEPGTKKIAVCDECGCKFSYEKIDVQTLDTVYYGNSTGRKTFVLCPQCHKEKVLEQTR